MTKASSLLLFFLIISQTNLFAQNTICGYAVNVQDSVAMNNVTVFVYDESNLALPRDIRTTTNEEGYYEIPDIPFGKYSINAWAPVTFRADTFAYIVQPGVFNIDSSFTETNLPCYFVNFFFKPHADEQKYDEFRNMLKKHYDERYKELPAGIDTVGFYRIYTKNLSPERLLSTALWFGVTNKDTLYLNAPSAYVRLKDW